MISRFFIDRPIMASVLAIVITLAGGVALLNLPVAQPRHHAQIWSGRCGATAGYVNNVAAPISCGERRDNMMYMFSTA
jgi:hypothetical protein